MKYHILSVYAMGRSGGISFLVYRSRIIGNRIRLVLGHVLVWAQIPCIHIPTEAQASHLSFGASWCLGYCLVDVLLHHPKSSLLFTRTHFVVISPSVCHSTSPPPPPFWSCKLSGKFGMFPSGYDLLSVPFHFPPPPPLPLLPLSPRSWMS